MRIAINGAGIAGPTLAYWLDRAGHQPTLIEKAPRLRTDGYVIDFWGVGYDVAERMGILPQVLDAGYEFQELRLVGADGGKVGGFSTAGLRRRAGGRFVSLARGRLSEIIYRAIEGRVETLFGDSIAAIEDTGEAVRVAFDRAAPREFDLVVGADGLHSRVRRIAFRPDDGVERDLGYRVATFEAAGYRPRDELAYVAHGVPGRQVARMALGDDLTTFLFVFRAGLTARPDPASAAEARGLLREVFAGLAWETPQILDAMDRAGEIYFDRVSQIRMPSWSKGRTALVGDAACAVSLLAGEGSGLGMTEAYVLAGELGRAGGDHRVAFARYEARLRPFVEAKQRSAEGFAGAFAPRTALGIWLRNQATRLMALPGLGEWLLDRAVNMTDDFVLPDETT